MSDKALAMTSGAEVLEQVVIQGDLAHLSPAHRVLYYRKVCESLGLNYLTKPFDYIELNNKLTLYAKRDATDQLRNSQHVSVHIVSREKIDDIYVVTAHAELPDGRTDESIAAVPLTKEDGEWRKAESGKRYFVGNGKWVPLRGDDYANALMKCETKAKRRVTLSIVGLGWLDETEIETIKDRRPVRVDTETGEIHEEEPVRTPATNHDQIPEARTGSGQPDATTATQSQVRAIYALCRRKLELDSNQAEEYICRMYGAKPSELSKQQASAAIQMLNNGQNAEQMPTNSARGDT